MALRTETANVPDDRRWIALAVLVAAQFMVVLDVAIVNVALPSIKTDLHFTQSSLQWVITAYALMFGGFLLLGGRMADLLGRRRSSGSRRRTISPSASRSLRMPTSLLGSTPIESIRAC